MNFVTCELTGRLGNQCFIIAACITTAMKNNADFLIPRNVITNDELYIKHLLAFDESQHQIQHVHVDNEFKFVPIRYKPNMMLRGYYQALEHTDGYLQCAINFMQFKYQFSQDVVGIHIRRGDYVQLNIKHPWDPSYYFKAIKFFTDKGFKDFQVFSDDIAWCKEFFSEIEHANFYYSENNSAVQDLELLSGCEHMICAASTFSVWAGYLNKNTDAIITRPSFFMGGADARLYRNVYKKNWIEIR